MTQKAKNAHNAHNVFCNYEIAKANKPLQFYTVQEPAQRKPLGIRTSNLSRAMLARQLASLF